MLKNILRTAESSVRWFFLVVVTLFLVEELIRVLWYVGGEWGFVQLLIDGAGLHKLGEFMIIVPFLLFVHQSAVWDVARTQEYVRKIRWIIWCGGSLNLIAAFDLFGRVDWAWWTILLIALASFLPVVLERWARMRAKWCGRILLTILMALFLFHYALSYMFTGFFIAPLAASHPSPADSKAQRWQQDLRYLATELPRLHLNAYHTIDQGRFEQEVDRLHDAIPSLDLNETEVGLQKLVAMIGDGHTQWDWRPSGVASKLPLELYWLRDSLFVTGAGGVCKDALGARVISIGSLRTEEAYEAICSLIPHESDGWWLEKSVRLLVQPRKLLGSGVVGGYGSVRFTFETSDGDTIECDFSDHVSSRWSALDRLPTHPPLYRTRSDTEYWSKYFKETRALYLKCNWFGSPVSFPYYSDEFWQMVEDSLAQFVIVDLRDNGGGNTMCFTGFFESILKHDNINRKNHLYVLVNRGSFSAATDLAVLMRCETNALLVGEEMGGSPNTYGEVRTFKLPNCGVRVSYSVKYFEIWPDSLPPFGIDILIKASSEQYFAGQDPVLDSVLQLTKRDLGRD